ncbi:MAG: GNAT family N-acetyltransferase, partial [Dehalococcoidia bacterium]
MISPPPTTVERLSAEQARACLDDLVELLRDAVDNAASVGFLPPLDLDIATAYWRAIVDGVARGVRVLLVARWEGRIVGTVQLSLDGLPNSRYRGEVQKLLVHTNVRRGGIARALMAAIEEEARRAGRVLLVLDTRRGDPAEQLYGSGGWTRVGVIP